MKYCFHLLQICFHFIHIWVPCSFKLFWATFHAWDIQWQVHATWFSCIVHPKDKGWQMRRAVPHGTMVTLASDPRLRVCASDMACCTSGNFQPVHIHNWVIKCWMPYALIYGMSSHIWAYKNPCYPAIIIGHCVPISGSFCTSSHHHYLMTQKDLENKGVFTTKMT